VLKGKQQFAHLELARQQAKNPQVAGH
jgi:hypothetical protein